jgi:hypothetical protein
MKKSKFYNQIILLFITISTLACNAQKYDNINKCNLNIFKNKKYTILKESLKDTTYSITPDKLFKKSIIKGKLKLDQDTKIDFEYSVIEINSVFFREYVTLSVSLEEFDKFYSHLRDEIFIGVMDSKVSYAKRKTTDKCVMRYSAIYKNQMFAVKYGIEER